MGMPATREFWTVEDVYGLPDDGQRYETVNGELLVTPGPNLIHQLVVHQLATELELYVRRERVGMVLTGPAEATQRNVTRVQPDVMVAPADWRETRRYGSIDQLLLVAEVVSPSSRRGDRFTKRVEFQRQRVPLYWVIDPDAESVEAWRPDDERPQLIRDALHWQPAGASAPFTLPLAALFAAP